MSKNRYLEIARELTTRISCQVYKVGQSLPPRQQLAEEFQVARATIDRCIEHLTASGVLTSRHGSGTYVNMADSHRFQVAFISTYETRLPRYSGLQWHYFNYQELTEKSERDKLLKYDGLIWFRPEEREMNEWIAAFQGKLPQVLVNRTMPGVVCVSIDYRGAYREITLERLRQYPGCRPVFLKMEAASAVSRYRESGFIDACREMGCFYDAVYLPDDFSGKLAALNAHDWGKERPILLVADSISHTGAVMKWSGINGWEWKKELLYSDFDNDLNGNIWGVTVTSYLQNDSQVIATAVKRIFALFRNEDIGPEHLLLFPERRNGDT